MSGKQYGDADSKYSNKEMIDSCLGLSPELAKLPVKHIGVDYDEGADFCI